MSIWLSRAQLRRVFDEVRKAHLEEHSNAKRGRVIDDLLDGLEPVHLVARVAAELGKVRKGRKVERPALRVDDVPVKHVELDGRHRIERAEDVCAMGDER